MHCKEKLCICILKIVHVLDTFMIIMLFPSQSRYHDLHGKGNISPKRKEEGEEIKWTERETQCNGSY